jgi:glycogen debranching enzyme
VSEAAAFPAVPRVALVTGAGAEEDAAWLWLQGRTDVLVAHRFTPDRVGDAVREASVVWVHATEPLMGVATAALAAFAASGGGVLLTLRAAGLVVPMGLELAPPNEDLTGRWHHDSDELFTAEDRGMPAYPHVRGLATFGPHPLVQGLHQGTYCWAPSEGEALVRTCYVHGVRPVDGRVVGVERAYLTQNARRIVAWEYAPGRGQVLCVGAFIHFAAPDALLRPQLERLVMNALRRVGGGGAEPVTWWPEPALLAAPSASLALPDPLDLEGALPEPGQDDLALTSDASADAPLDLAGRRALLTGREKQGIAELWVHPHRAVASWDVAVDEEPAQAVQVVVTADVIVRTVETAKRRLTETNFVALEHPVAIVEYAAARKGRASVGQSPTSFEITLTVDLRRMWPFAAGCSGNLRFRGRADGRAAVVATESDDGVAAIFASRPVELSLRSVHTSGVPVVECTIAAPLGVPLRLAVVGGSSRADLDRSLRAVARLGVSGLVRQRMQRAATVREARITLRAPEDRIPRALEWAKRRLDLFVGDVPGVGRSLLAGYAASQAGWGEARPGYAWFFGRDACWSAFALLAAGEHSVPRQVIRFLGDTQDVTGKVIHEVTTSGQHHYDAADATPLYLLLVARYFAWTADRDFVRAIWPHVERALAFCLTTDRDGDGLIENTRVGHGWIESGPMSGAHATLDLSSVWVAALEGLARTAEALGESSMAADCRARSARAGEAISSRLFDGRRRLHALDLRADGTRTWTQTALHAVAVVLGITTPERAAKWLDLVAGEAFSTPWGVRLLPSTDPLFSPSSYHGGTVWPLLTGWASCAEYRAGRVEAGFRHLAANASLAWYRQLGAFDEVLHGLEERGAGVCADQAWSAAMVIAPVVEGLFGVEPDAPNGRLTIAPALPAAWDWMEARGIRCGETVVDVRLKRRAQSLDIALRRTSGPPVWLTLAPWLGTAASHVEVDGERLAARVTTVGTLMRSAVALQVGGEHEVRFVAG